MISKYVLILVLTTCWLPFVNEVQAQDELLFLNGKELKGQLLEENSYKLKFKVPEKEAYILDKYRIFSYKKAGKESIVYTYDTLKGNFLSVHDMKLFVYGERDAHTSYQPLFVSGLGLAFGGAMGYLMHRDQNFLYVPTPFIYAMATLPFPTRVRHKRISSDQYLHEDEYLRGYERVARNKRTQRALQSSLVGLGLGFLVGVIAQ